MNYKKNPEYIEKNKEFLALVKEFREYHEMAVELESCTDFVEGDYELVREAIFIGKKALNLSYELKGMVRRLTPNNMDALIQSTTRDLKHRTKVSNEQDTLLGKLNYLQKMARRNNLIE